MRKCVLLTVIITVMSAATSQAMTILIDQSNRLPPADTGGAAIVTWFEETFPNATVIVGNFDDPSGRPESRTAIEAADVLVINRRTNSGGYDAADGVYYSNLPIPVVFLTSYVTRSSITAFEGGMNAGVGVGGAETTVTVAGEAVFDVPVGTYDWYTVGFDTLGTGSVGTGKVLATIGGNNLAVIWNVGDTDGSGRVQAGRRLLYNVNAINGGVDAVLPDTAAGLQAFSTALKAFIGQEDVPWQSSTTLRRPISPEQPMWLVHIDTWNYPDPQKIIDLVPQDIRPYVVMNISLSINHDTETKKWLRLGDGYETARSWLRICAENRMWAMVQQSSGGYVHFSDYDLSVYEDFYRNYPNLIGFNYAEQFWGFNDPPLSPPWEHRIEHFANLLELSHQYGGYLVVSWCGNQWSPNINPIAMLKRIPTFAAASRKYPENYILCEKYTQQSYISDMESLCLGAYLSGYSGQYGIRYDDTGWTDASGQHANFTPATGIAAHLEHVMLTGMTVIDGPELIWTQCFRGLSDGSTTDGYSTRRWGVYPQFENVSVDIFRKILDGTVRIPSRQEVIDRTKVVIINNVNSGSNDARYSSPETLFEGLYRMDGDGNLRDNKTFFKKTGRYPTIPTVYQLNDADAQTFQIKVNSSAYSTRWPTIASKVNEFNSLFPQEYTGDIYAGRHENGWVTYNPYKTGQSASGSIPFTYNTCDRMELTYSQYAAGVIKEYPDRITVYLNNYDNVLDTGLKTNVITIYGSTSEPTYSWSDRASHQASSVTKSWSEGVFTLTVRHNGPLDITINCAGTAADRLTDYTPAVLAAPARPLVYTGPRQYEAECFEYKSINGIDWNAAFGSTVNYTGQGFLRFGTNSAASVRSHVKVLESDIYRLETRYSNTGADRSNIHLYVNGSYVAAPVFTNTPSYSDWAINTQFISLNAGTNAIEFRAQGTGPSVYFDNIVVVPTVYHGDGITIQENGVGFIGVDGTIDSHYSGYTGDGYANTIDVLDAGIDWEVDFDASVTKAFTFQYACPEDRTADLIVNGKIIASEIQFPSTGSWSDWGFVTVYARAYAGVSGLRLQSTSTSGLPHIDYINIIGILPLEAPAAPTGLAATVVSADRIDLAWDASFGATSYNVKRSTTGGAPYTVIASLTETSYSDSGLSELTTYYYVVSGVNSAGESPDSISAEAMTPGIPPAAPTGLTAEAGDGSISLNWNANIEGDLAGYNVYRSTLPGGGYLLQNGSLLISPEFTDDDVNYYTTYYYVVTAVDEDALESDYSNEVSEVLIGTGLVSLSGADFESGFGEWVNITDGDSHDWLRYSAGTATPFTGPSGGANGSTWYVYLETSPGYANTTGNTAILESPVIAGFGRILTFCYHMHGTDTGTLAVDVYDGAWHDGVWSLSGQQHTSVVQPYTQAFVDLTGFTGPLRIRFRAVAAGGQRGDIAIDEIAVFGKLLYGDLSGDNRVDEDDLWEFVGYWLQEDCALDLNGDCLINLYEYAAFAENWLEESDP